MATTNPIVNSLPNYVEQNRLPILVKSILGAKTAKYITLQSDVKGPTAINLLDVTPVIGAAKCGWDEKGETALTQRVIDAKYLEVNMAFCDKKLYGKWAQSQLGIASGDKNMPFEEEFMDSVAKGIAAQVEKLIWQGDSNNAGEFDGFLKLINGVSPDVTVESGTSAYEVVKAAYMALPAEVAQAEDAVVFVSDATYRAFVQDLISANRYHYNGNDADGEMFIPGTQCKVVSVNGLNGAAVLAVAGRLSNFFYGTNALEDSENVSLWYSKDNKEFRADVSWTSGVQVAFPDEIVIAKESI